MDIHEHQAKDLLRGFGVKVPAGGLAHSLEQATYRAYEIAGSKCVIKAQVHTGGRGKAGGVKACGNGHEVFDAADEVSESKAEIAMKLMLMAGRKLSGKTLGIVGFGRIGREIARRAHLGFGMKIVVHNRSLVPDEGLDQFNAEQADNIDHLLGRSDFVSLHCPADAENRHFIDALRLNKMKPDAYLINTAGSELVDEEALADALWYDTIAGAGFDKIHNEPAICDRLVSCEKMVLLPHMGSATRTARQAA